MHWKKLILAGALFFAPGSPAMAQAMAKAPVVEAAPIPTPAHATPALWAVRDADTTIYLFGTIHLLKPEMRWFNGPVRTAFDESQEVVLEVVDQDDPAAQTMMVKHALQLTGPPLSSKLSPDMRTAYFAALASNGIAPNMLDRMKPWFAALTITVLPLKTLGYDPASGADRAIKAAAVSAGKQLVGLETSPEQIGFFNAMSEDGQLDMLNQTIAELPELEKTIGQMINAWSAGDADALSVVMNQSVDANPELKRILLTDRNARWADWIKARLEQPGTVFIAVGAGHLAGEGSVQDMLGQRGIAASPIKQAH